MPEVESDLSHQTGARRRYLQAYLHIAPLSLALWRAAEAGAVASVSLPRPLLDLGCGFGEFGSVFFREPTDVGLDIKRVDLRIARERGPYRHLVQADGRRLPFRDAAFASVLSVSVLEHVDEVQQVIAEVWRVLRPGGVFVFTTPSPKMGEMLFYPRFLTALGLGPLARWYGNLVDRFLHHVSLKPLEEWSAVLERSGFRVRQARQTVSPKLTMAFDLALPGALPSQIGRFLGRSRWVWRPPGVIWLWGRLLGSLVEEDKEVGCNFFFAAEKR
jgi:SAM-dependent methyltransferase